MNKVELLKYLQEQLIKMIEANKEYKQHLDSDYKANCKISEEKGYDDIWCIPYSERVCTTLNLKHYSKTDINRYRLLIQKLMLEVVRECD